MFDVSIQLISPLNSSTSESLFSVDNRTIEISSSDSTDILTFTTDENGIFDAELTPGSYQLSDSNSTDYVLFNSFKLEEDINISAHYSVATVVTGTMKVCTAPILSDCESGNSNATTSPTSNVEILFTSTSNHLEFTPFTNLDAEYQITLPGDLEFQLIAESTGNFGTSHYFGLNNSSTHEIGAVSYTHLTLPTKA